MICNSSSKVSRGWIFNDSARDVIKYIPIHKVDESLFSHLQGENY